MNVQLEQLITLATFGLMAWTAWKIKKTRWPIAVVALVLFIANPLRFEQPSATKLEHEVRRFDMVPEKVVVEENSFAERQKAEMTILKAESEDLKDEVHD